MDAAPSSHQTVFFVLIIHEQPFYLNQRDRSPVFNWAVLMRIYC